LQSTGQDAVNMMEESKDGNADQVNRGRMTDWSVLGVNILTEPLDRHEKVKVLAAAMNEAMKMNQAP